MTGFGRAHATRGEHSVQVDLRSLNHRFLEVRVRGLNDLPLLVQRCEDRLRESFARGSLELHVRWDGGSRRKRLGVEVARQYIHDLAHLADELGLDDRPTLSHLVALGVFAEAAPEEEEMWPLVEEALAAATAAVLTARQREGEALQAALAREADFVSAAIPEVERLVPHSLDEARNRIAARIEDLRLDADPGRVATELVLWAERSDVREEIDRLRSHLARFTELVRSDLPTGREIEFLAQEMGREAGTLSAKARSAELSQVAVGVRLAVERIREQARNVE